MKAYTRYTRSALAAVALTPAMGACAPNHTPLNLGLTPTAPVEAKAPVYSQKLSGQPEQARLAPDLGKADYGFGVRIFGFNLGHITQSDLSLAD